MVGHTELQNHRMLGVGRDPSGSASPSPGPAQDRPQESPHGSERIVQTLLDFRQA